MILKCFSISKISLFFVAQIEVQEHPINPCIPSPCGPNAQCLVKGETPSCSCLPQYIGAPPNCRPECVSNSECAGNKACINQKCQNPCPGACAPNAECYVISHAPRCSCPAGHTGNPSVQCILYSTCLFLGYRSYAIRIFIIKVYFLAAEPKPPVEHLSPCVPSPCGANAVCKEQNHAGSCSCLPEYSGNPYEGCRPECLVNTDCPTNKACVRNKCIDPCPGTCGANAVCQVVSHVPSCTCLQSYTGDPFRYCSPIPVQPGTIQVLHIASKIYSYKSNSSISVADVPQPPANPCHPSPCGANSQCREVNGQAVCSCSPTYVGSPPNCRPECVTSNECPTNKACINQKCTDPCPGTCGQGANCQVVHHSPICSCRSGFTGDPFTRCYPVPSKPPESPPQSVNPCIPSPCGPYSQCRDVGGVPSCSCLPEYMGTPPNCRPECMINAECPSILACIRQKCQDPCPGSCGLNAECHVTTHVPVCTCPEGYTGDPFSNCYPKPQAREYKYKFYYR